MLRRYSKRLATALLLACGTMWAGARGDIMPAPVTASNALERGFTELCNLKFDRAHASFDQWQQENPRDSLGPALHGSAYLIEQLYRLRLIANGFNKDDKRPAGDSGVKPDLKLRQQLYDHIARANSQALAQLDRNPRDENALLALAVSYGTEADYLNLVEKRPWASLTLFKKSNSYAQALLRLNPKAYDAWLASGFTEYLAGSLPFYVRWFVRFDSVKGDKQRAFGQLRIAAENGRYLRPFAKVLLAAVCARENRTAEAAHLLTELRVEFPDNPLFPEQLARLSPPRR